MTDAADELTAALDRSVHLERALSSSRQIGIAMGVLIERHAITEAEAFERLRTASQRQNVKLRDIAELLVTGCLDAAEAVGRPRPAVDSTSEA